MFAIADDDKGKTHIYGWGANDFGELGLGHKMTQIFP